MLKSLFAPKPKNGLEEEILRCRVNMQPTEALLLKLYYADWFIPVFLDAPTIQGLPSIIVNGERFTPVFTSQSLLRRAFPLAPKYVKLKGSEAAPTWPDDHYLMLNPKSPFEFLLPADYAQHLPKFPPPPPPKGMVFQADVRVRISEPPTVPLDLFKALADLCESNPEVHGLYRAWIHIEQEGEVPHLALGLRVNANVDSTQAVQAVSELLQQHAAQQISVFLVSPEKTNLISRYMLDNSEPIFIRKDTLKEVV